MAQSADLRFGNPVRFMPQSGEALYADICQGCHMQGGLGAVGAGAYPALAKNPKLASRRLPIDHGHPWTQGHAAVRQHADR